LLPSITQQHHGKRGRMCECSRQRRPMPSLSFSSQCISIQYYDTCTHFSGQSETDRRATFQALSVHNIGSAEFIQDCPMHPTLLAVTVAKHFRSRTESTSIDLLPFPHSQSKCKYKYMGSVQHTEASIPGTTHLAIHCQ
jgi:hypothetical protein